jgi:LruC domain-containing protein
MDDDGKFPNGVITTKDFIADYFNPFIIINQDRSNEVHLAGYKPTDKVSTKIFGTFEDNSKEGNYYKSKNNLPWALNIPAEIPHAIEKTDFINAYYFFADWAKTNGEIYTDWYDNNEKYRNNELLYIVK